MLQKILSTLFQTNTVDFGNGLAKKLSTLYPPSLDQPESPRISANRISIILERIYSEAQLYKQQHKISFIGRARMTHAFKWHLTDLGYSKAFVDMATEGLVIYLHKPIVEAQPSKPNRSKSRS